MLVIVSIIIHVLFKLKVCTYLVKYNNLVNTAIQTVKYLPAKGCNLLNLASFRSQALS